IIGRRAALAAECGMKTTTMNPSASSKTILVKRPAAARGKTELGWLHSRHTFSFGGYFDPDHMGYRSLRVINDDVVEAGGGFGEHPHRDAEIFSYVIDGDLQYISAGRGVFHSEFNPSATKPVHFLQIWLKPKMGGGEPRYAEKAMGQAAKANDLTLLFAGEPRDGAVGIRADADIYFGKLDAGKQLTHRTESERGLWLHVIEGDVSVA